jgi:hypothetical protein
MGAVAQNAASSASADARLPERAGEAGWPRRGPGVPLAAAPSLNRRAVGVVVALQIVASGCVAVYQPMSGLHRPVVVDPQVANLQDVRLTVHCVPKDFLDEKGAAVLCRKVATLFENQGAEVHTITTVSRFGDPEDEELDEPETRPAVPPPTDLTVELRARRLHSAYNPLLWVLCIGTLTLVPTFGEYTFVQEVEVRDASGFLLASDSLKGRLVRYFGLGAWAGNKLLDLVWREEEDELTGDRVREHLSKDLYGQLSQIVFNAKMQWQVLQQTAPAAAAQ